MPNEANFLNASNSNITQWLFWKKILGTKMLFPPEQTLVHCIVKLYCLLLLFLLFLTDFLLAGLVFTWHPQHSLFSDFHIFTGVPLVSFPVSSRTGKGWAHSTNSSPPVISECARFCTPPPFTLCCRSCKSWSVCMFLVTCPHKTTTILVSFLLNLKNT